MSVAERAYFAAEQAALELVGHHFDRIEPIGLGRNSRVYQVFDAGISYALKQYPAGNGDGRDRLVTEINALGFMTRHGITSVPDVIAADRERGFALLEWIDGTPLTEISEANADEAAEFLGAVHKLRSAEGSANHPSASEACLSGAEIERQIRQRLQRLYALPAKERDLHDYLDEEFSPELEDAVANVRSRLATMSPNYDTDLPPERCTLIPADFGFHNVLRRRDGRLAFLDFEYFGWDDPIKLIADTLWHPGMAMPSVAAQRLRQSACKIYADNPEFGARLDALYPLFGLRWCLILLNEFLPDRWQRRPRRSETGSWSEIKALQLTKARAFLGRVSQSNIGVDNEC